MKTKRVFWSIIIMMILQVSIPSQAVAHRLIVFAWVENDIVYVESKYSGGKRPKNADVSAVDTSGNVIARNKTDDNGKAQFTRNEIGNSDIRIIVNPGLGHQGEWTILKEEFDGSGSDINDAPLNRQVEDKLITPRTEPKCVSPDQLEKTVQKAVTKALDEKLNKRGGSLSTWSRESFDFTDIIAGIGYILGLVGLGTYISYRKKK